MIRTKMLFCILFSLIFCGQVFSKGLSPEIPSAQKIYDSIVQRLDNLEKRNPKDQADLFKIRELADELFQRLANATNPDNFDENRTDLGFPVNRDGSRDFYDDCAGLTDEALKAKLHKKLNCQTPVGYQKAQDIIFEKLDNHNGFVECVYTGRKLQTSGEPDASNMNLEHTWPQSQGAVGDAKSDLHHLFPTDSFANNKRGSWPFGWVKNPVWEQGGSEFDGKQFEVRRQQRGNTARAVFYFSIRYKKPISPKVEGVLRTWAKEDPVDAGERRRNDMIENAQHNRNAFVDRPDFIEAISDF